MDFNSKNFSGFHLETPLLYSHKLSLLNSDETHRTNVYLKLDNCQPTGSFKIRGIGHMVLESVMKKGAKQIIASSGGNAGLAAAYSAYTLGIKATIYVPTTTNLNVIQKLNENSWITIRDLTVIFIGRKFLSTYKADVVVHGSVWDETDAEARRVCSLTENCVYIPPFDDELIWKGNSSLIDEIVKENIEVDCVIASVGGGGLLCGVIEGLIKHKLMDKDIKVVAVETNGANCFNESVKQTKLVTLNEITSIAKSLGAKRCAQKLFDYYLEHQEKIVSLSIEDKESVKSCLDFLDDHKYLVEPSCAVSLSVAYNLNKYFTRKFKNVVVIVCGGSGLNLDDLLKLKEKFNL